MPENLQEVDPIYKGAHSDLYQVRVALERDLPKILDAVKKIGTPGAQKAAHLLDGLADKSTEQFAKSLKDASETLSKEWSERFDKEFDEYKTQIKTRLDAHVQKGTLSPEQAKEQLKDSLSTKRDALKIQLGQDYQNPLYFIRSLSNVQGSKLSWSNVGSKRTEKDLYALKGGWGKPPEVVDRITKAPADKPMGTQAAADSDDGMDDFVARLRNHKKDNPDKKFPVPPGPGTVMKRKAGEKKPGPVGWSFGKKDDKKESLQLLRNVIAEYASGRDGREPNWDLLEILL